MAIAQEQVLDSNEDTGPVVVGGSGDAAPRARQALSIAPGDYAPASVREPEIDLGYTPERERFDNTIALATSNRPGLQPQVARNNLDARGIDVPALMQRVSRKEGGSIKNYTDKSGKINLGSGRISTASKGKKNAGW